jgi:hypothetical protein
MPQNVEASKREGQKQTWQLASYWEFTTNHTSTSVKPGPAGGGSLPSDLSPGFLYHSLYKNEYRIFKLIETIIIKRLK